MVLENFIETILSPWTKCLIFPLISIVVSLIIKAMSRKDLFNNKLIKKDDFFFALSLMVTSTIMVTNRLLDLLKTLRENHYLDSERYDIMIMCVILLFIILSTLIPGLALFIRVWGWKINDDGIKELNLWTGIILPGVFSYIVLFGAFYFSYII